MARLSNMAILIVIAAATAILQSTEAAEYTVGDSTGWTNSPAGGASFYSNWASNITFRENDILVFNYVTGRHDVAELTKANFDSCNVNQNIQLLGTSPSRVTLNRTGEFYFACTFQGHCNSGQKLSVNVAAASGSSPPPAEGPSPPPPGSGTTPTPPSNKGAPPPSSTTTEPGASTPPSPGSATTLAATFSLLIAMVLNLLF